MHRPTPTLDVTPHRRSRRPHSTAARSAALLGVPLLAAFAHATAVAADPATLSAAASAYTAIDLYTASVPSGFSAITIAQGSDATYAGALVGYGTTTGVATHAIYWSPSGTATDFHPVNLTGIASSFLNATHGLIQVGYGSGPGTTNFNHALIWNGTPSATDVNPANFSFSQATGASDARAVGYGAGSATGNNIHAILWTGTVASDLNPANVTNSFAYGVDDVTLQAVGYGSGAATSNQTHALLWNVSSAAATDLHPSNLAGFTSSTAYAVAGHEQVGYGFGDGTAFHSHALLWHDSNVATDLNPANFTDSVAYATDGTYQVGYGLAVADGSSHALLWNGSSSAVDLQALLPAGAFISSAAYSLDASGDVFGTATDANNNVHVIEWTAAVPEPTTMLWLGALAVAPLLRRRRPRNGNAAAAVAQRC